MNFSLIVNLFVLFANGVTVGLIFWSTKMQKRGYQAQADVNRSQANVIRIMHARIANLERRVLSEEELGEASHVH